MKYAPLIITIGLTIVLYQLVDMHQEELKRHKEVIEKLNIILDGERFMKAVPKPKTMNVQSESKVDLQSQK